jgi:hypothetical protein
VVVCHRLSRNKQSASVGGLAGAEHLVYTGRMEFTDFMLWKALAIVGLAFLAGLFGFIETEDPESKAKRDKRPE